MSTTSSSPFSDDRWDAQLASMTIAEKEALLDRILVGIAKQSADQSPPAWHREVLDARRKAIEDGSEVFEDWEDVKRELRGES